MPVQVALLQLQVVQEYPVVVVGQHLEVQLQAPQEALV
jgi:hypothetical protein